MAHNHLLRVGALGHIGRFAAVDAVHYPRGSRVIARTRRGLEIAEVVAPPNDHDQHQQTDGPLLRAMTVEDELLQSRLEQNRQDALQACESLLAKRSIPAMLLDAEHLFDGQSLFFYFLGDVGEEVEKVTEELAEVYEAKVKIGRFAETLATGCGPDCGTESATGGGCDSCTTCAVAGACGVKPGGQQSG